MKTPQQLKVMKVHLIICKNKMCYDKLKKKKVKNYILDNFRKIYYFMKSNKQNA